ncbi:MAG: HAD family phosphatase [Candidatus Diapherotrites archaeon]|nr:HAD family phosphatase [Candidatus Diapherotrites archaeon]
MQLDKRFPDKIKAAIFDFDGILVDTEEVGLKTCETILKKYGASLTPKEKLDYFQIPDLLFYGSVLKSRSLHVDAKDVFKEHKELYHRLIQRVDTTLQGVVEILDYFKSQKVSCSTCSGSTRAIVETVLKNVGIQSSFDFIIAREDYTDDKPSPESYIRCLEKHGLPASSCIAFEDTRRGVESAKAAGIFTVGVLVGNHGSDPLQKADFQIYSLRDAFVE